MNSRQSRSEILHQHYRMILEKRETDPSQPLSIFCRAHNIQQWTYFYWKKKLTQSTKAVARVKAASFIPVTISSPAPLQHAYEIHFGNATHLALRPGFNPGDVGALVDILLSKDS